MSLEEIGTAILTSAVVSTTIAGIIKLQLEKKFEMKLEELRHSYEIELERIKNNLSIEADTIHKITERRLDIYPKIVEIVYRIRNMARDIANKKETPPVLVGELTSRARELEECLYNDRMDLQRDEVFEPIHTFKNIIKEFNILVKDFNYYKSMGDNEKAFSAYADITKLYDEKIEPLHMPIIQKLSTYRNDLEAEEDIEGPQ
jgi:hypothetical protein